MKEKNLLLKREIIKHERLFQIFSKFNLKYWIHIFLKNNINFMTIIGIKLYSLYTFSNFRQEFYFQNTIKYNY